MNNLSKKRIKEFLVKARNYKFKAKIFKAYIYKNSVHIYISSNNQDVISDAEVNLIYLTDTKKFTTKAAIEYTHGAIDCMIKEYEKSLSNNFFKEINDDLREISNCINNKPLEFAWDTNHYYVCNSNRLTSKEFSYVIERLDKISEKVLKALEENIISNVREVNY